MSSVAFLGPQNAPKIVGGCVSPQIPLGKLTARPRLPSWVQGAYFKAPTSNETGGKGSEGKRRGSEAPKYSMPRASESFAPPLHFSEN